MLFATATEWVARLQAAHNTGKLTANLFFQLVSSRYEKASLILTSDIPFPRWDDVFSDQVVTLKGTSYLLRNAEIETSGCAENRAD